MFIMKIKGSDKNSLFGKQAKVVQLLMGKSLDKEMSNEILVQMLACFERLSWINKCLDMEIQGNIVDPQVCSDIGYEKVEKNDQICW